mmetsp:Transcript_25514/g.82178  ORF Transcript_25514/g.82178 Transcript_25514/m.82178 type:complete len:525 (-) Transcript_25514:1525-3099(-)
MSSQSLSYFSKVASISLVLSLAAARRTAVFLVARAVVMAPSAVRVHSLILCSSLARDCLISEGGWPGTTGDGSLISGPLCKMKSVHAFVLALASRPACSTPCATRSTSSTDSSASLSRGTAFSFSRLAPASASVTKLSSSSTNVLACSSASFFFLSSSSFFSCSFFLAMLICSMRARACSNPLSLSSCIRCLCEPVCSSSAASTSSNSFWSASKFSGAADRTFWMTLRIARVDFCSILLFSSASFFFPASSCNFRASASALVFASSSARFTSSILFRCSSSFFRLMSSITFFCSSNAFRLSSSSFFLLSSCWFCCFFSCFPPPPPPPPRSATTTPRRRPIRTTRRTPMERRSWIPPPSGSRVQRSRAPRRSPARSPRKPAKTPRKWLTQTAALGARGYRHCTAKSSGYRRRRAAEHRHRPKAESRRVPEWRSGTWLNCALPAPIAVQRWRPLRSKVRRVSSKTPSRQLFTPWCRSCLPWFGTGRRRRCACSCCSSRRAPTRPGRWSSSLGPAPRSSPGPATSGG